METESLNERSRELINHYYQKLKNKNLNYDGVVNETCYLNSCVKILYILKETWSKDNNKYSIVRDMNEWICRLKKPFADKTLSKKMFDRLSEWTYGILHNCSSYEKVKEKLNELPTYHYPLCCIGYINLSKLITQNSTTSNSDLEKYFNQNKELIKEQIKLLKPDVIIACGVNKTYGIADKIYSLFKTNEDKDEDWRDGGSNGCRIITVDNKKVGLISSIHPSGRFDPKEMFENMIKGWNNLKYDIDINC